MSRRDQLLLIGVIAVVAIGAFYLLLVSPERKSASNLDTQLAAVQARRDQAVQSVTVALAAKARYPGNVTALRRLTPAMPPVDSTSSLLRQIDAAAVRAHVDFSSITLSSSGGSAPTPAAAAAATTSTAPGARGTAPAIPPGYVTNPAVGVPVVNYTTTFTGTYLQLQHFLGSIRHFVAVHPGVIRVRGRLLDVSGIGVTAQNVTVALTAYLLAPPDQAPITVPRSARAAAQAASQPPAGAG